MRKKFKGWVLGDRHSAFIGNLVGLRHSAHNFGRAMALFQPDEVIYPHQHARIRDEKGKLINIDTKYELQVEDDGVRLVEDPNFLKSSKKQILVTYIPLGFLAEEDFKW